MGPVGKAMTLVTDLIANCVYFRQWQGASWTVEEAKRRIYPHGLPDPTGESFSFEELDGYRPFVALYEIEEGAITLNYQAAPNIYRDSGSILARFEQSAECREKATVEQEFADFIDNVVRTGNTDEPGMVELSGVEGYMHWTDLEIGPAFRTHPTEIADMGDAIFRDLVISWSEEEG